MARRRRGHGHGLRRRTGTRSRRRTFVVLCEGTVTEPGYLDALKRLREVRDVASVRIEVDRDRSGAVPLTLVEAAIELKKRNDEIDEIWCLFDVEAPKPHPNLKRALDRASDAGINTAVSNPCFEVWLVLHFDKCGKWLTTPEAVRLRRAHDGSAGKEVDGELYMPRREIAAQRARDLHNNHIDNGTAFPNDNPSSGVFRLLQAVERGATDHHQVVAGRAGLPEV